MDKLLQDALQAYNELGGEEYLEKHPELLERILLYKMSKIATEQTIDLVIEIPWLDRNRLSYRDAEQSALRIEHQKEPIEDAIEAKPWREKPADYDQYGHYTGKNLDK